MKSLFEKDYLILIKIMKVSKQTKQK